MEKMIKYKGTDKLWKMIDRKEFHRLVAKWAAIRKAENLVKAVEEDTE